MEPSRLLHGQGHGRTELRLTSGDHLLVLESPREVLAQLDAVWVVLMLDDDTECHVRSSSVIALVDLEKHESNVRPLRPEAA